MAPSRGRPPGKPHTPSSTPTSLADAITTTNPETPPSANTRAAAAQRSGARQSKLGAGGSKPASNEECPPPDDLPQSPVYFFLFPRLKRQQNRRDRFMMHAIQPVVIGILAAMILSWQYRILVPLAGWGFIMVHVAWMYIAALLVAEVGYLGWWRGQEG